MKQCLRCLDVHLGGTIRSLLRLQRLLQLVHVLQQRAELLSPPLHAHHTALSFKAKG